MYFQIISLVEAPHDNKLNFIHYIALYSLANVYQSNFDKLIKILFEENFKIIIIKFCALK